MKFFLIFLLILGNTAFANKNIKRVDFPHLLEKPQLFDGKDIEVVGFATIEFERNALYVDSDSQKKSTFKKGVWLEIARTSFELKKYNGLKVLVRGVFRESNKGHMGLWKGALEKVSKLELLKE